jgi:predicted TPR repeat methyltransferase
MTQESAIADILAAAVRLHTDGDPVAAEALYRQVLVREPEHPDALHLLGLIEQAAGDLLEAGPQKNIQYMRAAASIRRALALRPGEAVFHYNLANVLYQAGQLEAAIASYRAALALRPDDPDTLLNLGNALAAHGEPAAAADSYRLLLQHAPTAMGGGSAENAGAVIRPQQLAAQVNLAQVLRVLGDAAGARAAYQAALALDAGNVKAQFGLGVLDQEAGDFEAALQHYQAALQTDPDCAPAWNNLGTWHQERGERMAAADCYRRALALDPLDAEAHNNLGTLFADADRIAEAEACYRAALDARPEFAEAHKNRGVVLQALGRRDEALASFREAVRLRPDFGEATYKLAALSGEPPPASAPAGYIAALFDSYAGDYDQHLATTLQYRVPQALCALFVEQILEAGELDVLDLGCGTGLSGAALRGLARQLTGIDLSPRMLAHARERGLYDCLIEGDIVQVLAGQGARFDLVAAADVFVYIGDLESVLASIAQVLQPGGWLAFSVESLSGGEYRLQPTGRYAHAPAYLEALARRHGFERVAQREVTLRVEQGSPVVGLLQLWQRALT